MEHTPGEWKYSTGNTYFIKTGRLITSELIIGEEGQWIAAVLCNDIDNNDMPDVYEQEANAHLISAAPDMYAALTVIKRDGLTNNTQYFIDKALAKAEGG